MKIIKYGDFIKENLQDTPENYIAIVLNKLKRDIDKIFDYKEESDDTVLKPEELKRVKSDKMTFKDLGVRLESSEVSKYSKLYDSLTVKFSDDQNTYTLIIMIDIKEAIPEDKEKDFDPLEDVKKCYIKFKKYDLDTFEILGQVDKNVKVKDIDEDFIIDLKIEIDEKFGESEDEFEIETE
jgi:hypothetical protein